MGVLKSVPSVMTVGMAAVFGTIGLLGVDGPGPPPARVVDAVVDTSGLASMSVEPPVTDGRSAATSTSTAPTITAAALTVPVVTATTPATTSAAAATATSTTTSTAPALPARPPTPRDRGERALAAYSYDWRNGIPGWEISFHEARSGVLGYTFVEERRIEVYVRPEMSESLLAHVIAHEIAHAIDVTHNSGDDRARWQALRGIEEKPWWPGNGASDFSTGAGDFAESFAAWQVGDGSFRSMIGDPPEAAEFALLLELSELVDPG